MPGGRIVLKLNSIVDPAVIDALYTASQKGADIDLIVRGICCLRPGVPGLSENIRVRSIVGRYLEHSRVFAFGDDKQRPVRYFLGSADMMERNLDRRIEVVVPVEDPELRARLAEVIEVNLSDDTNSWRLRRDGRWSRVPRTRGISTHKRLQELAVERLRLSREPEVGPLRSLS
jgi:polyphosphate kinase